MPIDGWNRATERAVRFGLMLSDDITAIHVSKEEEDRRRLRELWKEKVESALQGVNSPAPQLEIIDSPGKSRHRLSMS
jgi:hypothetical protein